MRSSFLLTLLVASSMAAQSPSNDRLPTALPFHVLGTDERSVELVLDLQALEALRTAPAELTLGGVQLPGGRRVDLSLRRPRSASRAPSPVWVDGQPTGLELGADAVQWTGSVQDQASSEAWLSFSEHGSWGWIRSEQGLVHLVSTVDRSYLVVDDEAGTARPFCSIESSSDPLDNSVWSGGIEPVVAAGGARPVLEVTGAFETTWQYYERFGDLGAAQAYAAALLGGLRERFLEQLDVLIQPVYVGFWTTSADPWDLPDLELPAPQVLDEFRLAWRSGGAPVRADFYHMLNGGAPQGGHAEVRRLCNQRLAFGITCNVDGLTNFPAAPAATNYDFVIAAHEIGHTFGAIHTHEICPPIDSCANQDFYGPCQTGQTCTRAATLMSYCGLCPGGFANFTTYFHPTLVRRMRNFIEQRLCVEPFEGVLVRDLGAGWSADGRAPVLDARYEKGQPDRMLLHVSHGEPQGLGVVFLSRRRDPRDYLGSLLIPSRDLRRSVVLDASGSATIATELPGTAPLALRLFVQGLFVDGRPSMTPGGASTGLALSNALELELLRPVESVSEPLSAPGRNL